jgi:hypothetical protein
MSDKHQRSWGFWFFAVFAAYFTIAITVFGFRHPWATDTERLIYTWEALTFQRVPYETMRPREDIKP